MTIANCPVCRSRRVNYAFSLGKTRIVRCVDCDFLFLNPQPSDEVLREIYRHDYFLGAEDEQFDSHVAQLKTGTAEDYVEILTQGSAKGDRLLEVGCGHGYMLKAAEDWGFEVLGVEFSEHAAQRAQAILSQGSVLVGQLGDLKIPEASFDICVLADVIEHLREPRRFLELVWSVLKPGGRILIAAPTLDSWSARLMGNGWMEFKVEHMSYFSRQSLESLLWQTGFESVRCRPGQKTTSLRYVIHHFLRFPVFFWTPLMKAASRVLPRRLTEKPFSFVGSGILVTAKKGPRHAQPLLSIIVPAYNEGPTIGKVLEALSAKIIDGVDREIIVVEGNSTDGTRETVKAYGGRPGFRVILEEAPRGKGAATRAGLAAARGDIVLIQDADLEYDLEDYELLLEPILAGREAFVLGARHGGRAWKMRHYSDQPLHSLVLNLAHWGFTAMINVSLGLRLRDPFTMYKVFRRDCLTGLTFTCRRFDFDWELLIKLVRKGYRPIEIPVNYHSRSFKEGKKIRIFRDPLTWMVAWAKARFGPLGLD